MKVGVRKPSLKKSISARTTGRAKRAVKSSINPAYGKKGMGYINNPKKAVYNKIYNKTTVGVNDIIKDSTNYTSSNIDSISSNDNIGISSIFEVIKLLIIIVVNLIKAIFYGALLFGMLYIVFKIIL